MQRPTKAQLQALMAQHIGRAKGVSVNYIAGALDCSPRLVRLLVTEAREAGTAICGTPATGYFIAETKAELDECCAYLHARAMHSLAIIAKLRHMPLADLVGQLHLKT